MKEQIILVALGKFSLEEKFGSLLYTVYRGNSAWVKDIIVKVKSYKSNRKIFIQKGQQDQQKKDKKPREKMGWQYVKAM